MLSKKFTPKRTVCKVTFTMPANVAKEQVAIAGDFNDWNPADHLLEKKKDTYQIELRLKPEQSYRFKYLIDNQKEYPHIRRIENLTYTPTWLHLDAKETGKKEIHVFNP